MSGGTLVQDNKLRVPTYYLSADGHINLVLDFAYGCRSGRALYEVQFAWRAGVEVNTRGGSRCGREARWYTHGAPESPLMMHKRLSQAKIRSTFMAHIKS